MNDLNEVKKKAAELKRSIETLLSQFRSTTGYTAEVKIDNKVTATNDGNKVAQIVSVNLSLT